MTSRNVVERSQREISTQFERLFRVLTNQKEEIQKQLSDQNKAVFQMQQQVESLVSKAENSSTDLTSLKDEVSLRYL